MHKEKSKYYIKYYIRKSFRILLPLVEENLSLIKKTKAMNAYLYWDQIEDSILDNKLLVEYPKGSEYGGNKLTIGSYSTESSEILVYDLDEYKEDVLQFLEGNYSKFSTKAKDKILTFYQWVDKGKVINVETANKGTLIPQWHVILYPDSYREIIGNELWETDCFDSLSEALLVTKDMVEFLPLFDLEKETLKKKLI